LVNRIALTAGAAALLATGGITAAQATSDSAASTARPLNIGNCTTEGEFVSCSVQGDISHPRIISVQVWATPSQQITVTWGDLCAAGFTSGERSGQFKVMAGPAHKATRRVPLAAGHAGKCTPDVLVSLGSAGRLHVYLSGKH
jgi:hypothetical protein